MCTFAHVHTQVAGHSALGRAGTPPAVVSLHTTPRGCAGVAGDHKCFRGAVAVGFVFAAVDPPSGLAGGGLDIPWVEDYGGFPEPTIHSPHNTRPPGTKPREVPSPYPGGKWEFLFSGPRRSVVVVYNSTTGSDLYVRFGWMPAIGGDEIW